jgi:hypothetical protein
MSGPCLWPGSGARARVGRVSGAVAAGRPGPRSEPPGTAELLCALSYGSGLAAAERMEHGTNTAFVGVQLGHALGAEAADLEAVFYGALVKDAGCGACGAVLARYFPLMAMHCVGITTVFWTVTLRSQADRCDPCHLARPSGCLDRNAIL